MTNADQEQQLLHKLRVSLADNALLVVAIALLVDLHAPAYLTPMLKFVFVLFYVILAPFVGAFADSMAKGRVMFISNTIKIVGCSLLFLAAHQYFALAAYAVVGLGAANLAAGFFQGFPVSSSSSRTPVAEAAGAKTQMTGVVGALAVALLLVAAPNLLQHLPNSALAAVVIASAIGLIEVKDLIRIYRVQQWEFWLSMLCLAGVAVLGAIPGIALAVVVAIIEFLWDAWRPHSAVLGRADGVKGYHDITRYPDARRIPGLVLFRWDAPLFFANAELFQERVLEAADKSPTPVRWLVVAAEPVTSVDITAADILAELDQALRESGIEFCFAELKDPVKDKLKRFGLFSQLGERAFFPTLGAAVGAYLEAHPVDWVDWEERS